MALIFHFPGGTPEQIYAGLKAAVAVFNEADASPELGAVGMFAREDSELRGLEAPHVLEKYLHAAEVHDCARLAARKAARASDNDAGVGLEVTELGAELDAYSACVEANRQQQSQRRANVPGVSAREQDDAS